MHFPRQLVYHIVSDNCESRRATTIHAHHKTAARFLIVAWHNQSAVRPIDDVLAQFWGYQIHRIEYIQAADGKEHNGAPKKCLINITQTLFVNSLILTWCCHARTCGRATSAESAAGSWRAWRAARALTRRRLSYLQCGRTF